MMVKGCSVVVKAQGRWKQRGGWLDGEVELRTLEVDTFLGEGKIEGLSFVWILEQQGCSVDSK